MEKIKSITTPDLPQPPEHSHRPAPSTPCNQQPLRLQPRHTDHHRKTLLEMQQSPCNGCRVGEGRQECQQPLVEDLQGTLHLGLGPFKALKLNIWIPSIQLLGHYLFIYLVWEIISETSKYLIWFDWNWTQTNWFCIWFVFIQTPSIWFYIWFVLKICLWTLGEKQFNFLPPEYVQKSGFLSKITWIMVHISAKSLKI